MGGDLNNICVIVHLSAATQVAPRINKTPKLHSEDVTLRSTLCGEGFHTERQTPTAITAMIKASFKLSFSRPNMNENVTMKIGLDDLTIV